MKTKLIKVAVSGFVTIRIPAEAGVNAASRAETASQLAFDEIERALDMVRETEADGTGLVSYEISTIAGLR